MRVLLDINRITDSILIVWIYYTNYPKDPIGFKILVTFMGTLALLDTATTGYWVYLWAVLHWGGMSPS